MRPSFLMERTGRDCFRFDRRRRSAEDDELVLETTTWAEAEAEGEPGFGETLPDESCSSPTSTVMTSPVSQEKKMH